MNKLIEHSALDVMAGIEQPPQVNPNAMSRMKKLKPKQHSAQDYIEAILQGNRVMLSKAITLVESKLPEHHALAQAIIEGCLPHAGKSIRIGITGVPGAGKSTFIEALGGHITGQGHRLAVLAIDPSSERSKGSILGDKTRMETLCNDKNAFIRPSPTAGSLGGVARKTRETIILCEAAGFDVVFVETVGVGQSETQVHSMVDAFLLLMLAGAGDELQGIKRGIMEMADILAITKADGHNVAKATAAMAQYQSALRLFPPTPSGWNAVAMKCSALTKEGIVSVWEKIIEHIEYIQERDFFTRKRREQDKFWMIQTMDEAIRDHFYHHPVVREQLPLMEEMVMNDRISSFQAAKKLLDLYFDPS